MHRALHDGLALATNQEVARSSRAGRTIPTSGWNGHAAAPHFIPHLGFASARGWASRAGRTNLRSLESPASNGWQGRFPPLVGGSGPEGPSIRNLHPDEAATRAAVLERVHGQRDLVTGLQRRELPSVAKHHSRCP